MIAAKIFLSTAILNSLVHAMEAPINYNNVAGIATAHLDKNLVKGMIEFTSTGGLVNVHLDVTGLPRNSTPFEYYISNSVVPLNGDCSMMYGIMNPYEATYEVCDDFDNDALCAIGDLSGKHGFINTTCFEISYVDPYLSLNVDDNAFIGGKSIIVIDSMGNKVACGNIELESDYNLKMHKASIDVVSPSNDSVEIDEEQHQNLTELHEIIEQVPISIPVAKNASNITNVISTTTEFNSGSNILYVSSIMGVIFGSLAALL